MENTYQLFDEIYKNQKVQESVRKRVSFTLRFHPREIRLIIDKTFSDFFETITNPEKNFTYDPKTICPYMARCAHNKCIDFIRKKKRLVITFDEKKIFAASSEDRPVELDKETDIFDKLDKAIEQLPTNQRDIVRLRFLEIPFKAIAEKQDESINTLVGRMRYARTNLKKMLQAQMA